METRKSRISWPYRAHETKVIHGAGTVDSIPQEVDYLGSERLLLLSGPHAAAGRTVAKIKGLLGQSLVAQYDGVRPHAQAEVVHEVAELVRSEKIDTIVTVGGGSTSDTAKGVVCELGEDRPIEQLASVFTPPDTYVEQYLKSPKIPIICVPGTLSGAEAAPGFGVTDAEHIKRLYRGDYVASRILILDPEGTLDTDLDVFLQSGGNGLAHGIEALYSRSRQPMSDGLSMELIRIYSTYLERVRKEPDNLDYRMQLLYGSFMGGLVMTNARMGIHHGVCHCLGARLGLSHGMSNSIMLPYSMAFNLEVTEAEQAKAATAMGVAAEGRSDRENAMRGIERVNQIKANLGIPNRLSDLPNPPDEELLRAVAEDTMGDRALYFNPKPVHTVDDVYTLLLSAL